MTKKVIKTARFGCQTPRIDIYLPGDTAKAELLFELLDEYGMRLLDWQKLVLLRWLAEDELGNFTNLDCGLEVPRQNGKTEIIVARIIYGIIFRKAIGLFTAQQQDTVDVVKKRVQDFFYENEHEEIFNLLTPRFRKKPRNYAYIEFENGSVYKFKTRTRLSGLGNTNDELINDEAADMMDSHQSTLLPTTSAARSGNPQVIYVGTPPMAESVGEVFPRNRKEKLAGAKGAWTEWSVESFTDKLDEDSWYKTNPSLGYFLLHAAVETESRSLSSDDFNRMRLGWWSGIEDKRAISQKTWDKLIDDDPKIDEVFLPVYAIKFAPDRSAFSLVVGQPLTNGKILVEIIMQRPMQEGFDKVSRWLLERWRNCAKIIIDGSTGDEILYDELTKSGIPTKKIAHALNMKDVVAAHQFMYDAITRGELSHYNQPLLNQTIRITKTRPFGRFGGFGWQSMSDQISTVALDAATFAFWGQKVFSKKKSTAEDSKMSQARWNEILGNL